MIPFLNVAIGLAIPPRHEPGAERRQARQRPPGAKTEQRRQERSDDGEPIDEKLARLRAELYTEFEDADRLERIIRERLEGLIGDR